MFKKIFGMPFFFSENGFLLVKSVHVLFIEDLGFALLEKTASTSLVIAFELNTQCVTAAYTVHIQFLASSVPGKPAIRESTVT